MLDPTAEPFDHYSYWGKASPLAANGAAPYHLLVYHSLDVAAVGYCLSGMPDFGLDALAHDLGWSIDTARGVALFFLAIHDLGKFSRAFQGLVPGLSPLLVPVDQSKRYSERHDTLGWLLWRDYLGQDFPSPRLPRPVSGFWEMWAKACMGHHGKPPKEASHNGLFPLAADSFFCAADVAAARHFIRDVTAWLLPKDIPPPTRQHRETVRRHSWRLAGFSVLADWLGSNQLYFPYCSEPDIPLRDYWEREALPRAEAAIQASGLARARIEPWTISTRLFPQIVEPTPLQQLAAEIQIKPGTPQLFILEDVTGAGKTEAALILAHRLMAAGLAGGIYFGLPTMATANQMYQRVGSAYRRLYADDSSPSLVLAHGARELVDGFRGSVLHGASAQGNHDYQAGENSATSQCSAWLADSQKRALLAHVGVGTLDQALLGILPVRHQSLRLVGLASKVLIVDEAHAYDAYMRALLARLLKAHAMQGGSAVLLSATLPADMRRDLSGAFQEGLGLEAVVLDRDPRYPLVTHVHKQVSLHPCDTRPTVRRRVAVAWLHDEASVRKMIREQAAQGASVCWIRNTVVDARQAYSDLAREGLEKLLLFHSRYAMGDRLDIEATVLARFGKHSVGAQRHGQVLVASQVVEQSLDLDFDVLVSDLAPIDLLIQRAGRLQRHVRNADGDPADTEGRPAPVLHVLGPEPDSMPPANWYEALLPRACFVYPDVGALWLTQQVLLAAGGIDSPGLPGRPDAVRSLVEAVYGEHAQTIPDSLMAAKGKYEGMVMAHISQAGFNALDFERGYCQDSSNQHWYEDTKVPTRLGEETFLLYLARVTEDGLLPWAQGKDFAWQYSAVRVDARLIDGLAPDWAARHAEQLSVLRAANKLLEDACVLPLEICGNEAVGQIVDGKGRVRSVVYDNVLGWRLASDSTLGKTLGGGGPA